MTRIPRHRRPVQFELFQQQTSRPKWATLPAEVRQKTIPLLVQLLISQHAGRPVAHDRKEVDDE